MHSTADDRSLTRDDRQGMALAMAVIAIVVIGALIGSVFLASSQDARLAHRSRDALGAFMAAERGLSTAATTWEPSRNLDLAVGGDTVMHYDFLRDGLATVHVRRVNDDLYWLISEGSFNIGPTTSVRRATAVMMRLDFREVPIGAALTVSAGADIRAGARLSGSEQVPQGWKCAGPIDGDTSALAHAPEASVSVDETADVRGRPAVLADSSAGAGGQIAKYGDDAVASLAQRADLVVTGDIHPAPLGSATECVPGITNWGEPHRGSATVLGCTSYFPIVWAPASLSVSAGRGQGILLVSGDLRIGADFEWTGIIIVKGDVLMADAGSLITGALIARHASIGGDLDGSLSGPAIQLSSCALAEASRGSARLTPVRQRAWTEVW